MYKTSAGQIIKILIIYLFFGGGIGAVISIGLVMGKALPDNIVSALIFVLPTFILYAGIRMILDFNQIQIQDGEITVISFLGKKTTYVHANTSYAFQVQWHTAYGAKYAPMLLLKITDTASKREKLYKFVRYSEKQIAGILEALPKT